LVFKQQPEPLTVTKPGYEVDVGVLAREPAEVEVERPAASQPEADARAAEQARQLADQLELNPVRLHARSIRARATAPDRGERDRENAAVPADHLEPSLARRLSDVGLDPRDLGDPRDAWQRLHDRFGRRVTLVDRYALEAASRGIRPDQLDPDDRARLTREVLAVQYPGMEFTPTSGRRVQDPVEVVPYREEWAEGFRAWRERLSEALGDTAVRIDHVGSTALRGLDAKPVVDIQISVGDVEDEDRYVPAIEGLGIALRFREPRHRYFRPSGDLPRSVQIHVCEAGGEWEREHLLFRDFLRANPEARDAYARLKRELADWYRDDRIAYNEGKTGFILDTLDEARAWAERIGWTP
jgi:GrpB-like predicted nucleotidyltransferase (UPF0157 family)